MKKIFTILGISVVSLFNAQIVINEAYGGGGNSGATIKQDFIELKNVGTTAVTLTGAYLWYGSATGALGGTDGTLNQALPSITLQPGQTYLIQQGTGAGGTIDIPTADFVPTNPFNMGAANFKVALTTDATAPTSATSTNVIDFLGAGTANLYEGSAAAPAGSNSTSVQRVGGDTNNNNTDFTSGAPTPTNSSGQALGVSDVNGTKVRFIKNTLVDNVIEFTAKANVKVYNVNGQLVKSAAVNDGTSLDVSALAKGVYVISGEVDGQSVSQKIIKK